MAVLIKEPKDSATRMRILRDGPLKSVWCTAPARSAYLID